MNKFLFPPEPDQDLPEIPPHGGLLAAYEVPDPERQVRFEGDLPDEPVYLECIDASWYQATSSVLGDSGTYTDVAIETAPLFAVELTGFVLPATPQGLPPGSVAWFDLRYERAQPGQGDALLYPNLFAAGIPVRIVECSTRSPFPKGVFPQVDTGSYLSSQFKGSLPKSEQMVTPQAAIAKRLKLLERNAGVAIYDVGQGACQAIVDSFGVPQLYVDFGGGVLGNMRTFPKQLNGFCFSHATMIVLSHWDWDHWSSAWRDSRALETTWLTPEVPTKPIQQAMAYGLISRGKLIVWDSTWPTRISSGGVTIERCTGKTSNDSGLAVTARPHSRSSVSMLLPGDAAYDCIPSVVGPNGAAGAKRYNGLVMTHHGGRIHGSVYPLPKRKAVSVLSAGPSNTYRHPLFGTLKEHIARGWSMPLRTAASGERPSHVLLPWNGRPKLFLGGCLGFSSCANVPASSGHVIEL